MPMFGNFLVKDMRQRSRRRARASYSAIRMDKKHPMRHASHADEFIETIDDIALWAPYCPRSEGNTRNRKTMLYDPPVEFIDGGSFSSGIVARWRGVIWTLSKCPRRLSKIGSRYPGSESKRHTTSRQCSKQAWRLGVQFTVGPPMEAIHNPQKTCR